MKKSILILIFALMIILISPCVIAQSIGGDCGMTGLFDWDWSGQTISGGECVNNPECAAGQRDRTHYCSVRYVCTKLKCECGFLAWDCEYECARWSLCYEWLVWSEDCDDKIDYCTQDWCRWVPDIPNTWMLNANANPTCCGDDDYETWCGPKGLQQACLNATQVTEPDNNEQQCMECSDYAASFDKFKTSNKCCGDEAPLDEGRYIQFQLTETINLYQSYYPAVWIENGDQVQLLGIVSDFTPSTATIFSGYTLTASSNDYAISFTPDVDNPTLSGGLHNSPIYAKLKGTPDDPDESEFFCRGVSQDTWGCPFGRFSETDKTGSYSRWDTRIRAWLPESDNTRVGCCGDDWGDEGYILPLAINGSQRYYLCDNKPGQLQYEWRPTVRPDGVSNAGKIYRIRTDPANYNRPVYEKTAQIDYDIVASDLQKWIPCDIHNSLPSPYKLQGIFGTEAYCSGTSGWKCKPIKDSDYICYDDGREEIAECSALGDVNTGDDVISKGIGDTIPNPFHETWPSWSYQGLVPTPGTGELLTLTFRGADDYFLVTPKIRDWSTYEYISFDVHFERLESIHKLFVQVSSSGTSVIEQPLLDFATVNSVHDYHIIIPGISYSNVSAFGFIVNSTLNLGQVRFTNFYLSGGQMQGYYCSVDDLGQSDWRSDLDTDVYSDGRACEQASYLYTWTGSQCCGDDYTTTNLGFNSEFYRDIDANCWDSKALISDIVEMDGQNAILGFAGNFYSCFGPSDVINLRSTVTGEPLINESQACDAYGNYFCSNQQHEWSDFGYSLAGLSATSAMGTASMTTERFAGERTALKHSPDGSSAECCHPDDCWNGTQCKPSQQPGDLPYDATGFPDIETAGEFKGARCINGEWQESDLKWDWLDMTWGFCEDESECLFDSNSCVPSGWYSEYKTVNGRHVPALYCENGDWTSRTKKLAQEMLNIRTDNFVLDCGSAQEVLNFYSQKATFSQLADRFENVALAPELNNFCVLSYGDNILIGTTYNPYHDATLPSTELRTVLSNAFDVKGFSISNCIGNLAENKYHDCSNGVWYNDITKSIIYDPEAKIDLDGNIFSNFYNYIVGAISGLFGVDVSVTAGERILIFANRTRLFNNLYVSKHGNQMIKAVVEEKQTRPGVIAKVLTATYEGFETTICDSVRTYSANAVCNETDGKEVVLAIDRAVGPQQFSELVLDLTRRTRVD